MSPVGGIDVESAQPIVLSDRTVLGIPRDAAPNDGGWSTTTGLSMVARRDRRTGTKQTQTVLRRSLFNRYGCGIRTLPGFMIPFGSSNCLMPRMMFNEAASRV